jgi:Mg2+ and Co2+ transporter CorA
VQVLPGDLMDEALTWVILAILVLLLFLVLAWLDRWIDEETTYDGL